MTLSCLLSTQSLSRLYACMHSVVGLISYISMFLNSIPSRQIGSALLASSIRSIQIYSFTHPQNSILHLLNPLVLPFPYLFLNMNNPPTLPALACYKPQCQHSSQNWFAYQAGLEEVRLVEFAEDHSIKTTYQIQVGPEPLRALRVVYSQQEKQPFVGLALLSKYMIFKKNAVLCSFDLMLTCNIADFSSGLVAVDGVNDGTQTYFVFTTSKGQITTVTVSHPETKVSFKIEADSKITSLCVQKSTFAFLGTERGRVIKVDMNSRKIIEKYDTDSQFPIYNLRVDNDFLIFGTCHGELHIVNHDLKEGRVVSAHQGMVALLWVTKDSVYSVGDDLVLRVWAFSKDGSIAEKRHEFYDKKPNLLFSIKGSTFINFYEETELVEV